MSKTPETPDELFASLGAQLSENAPGLTLQRTTPDPSDEEVIVATPSQEVFVHMQRNSEQLNFSFNPGLLASLHFKLLDIGETRVPAQLSKWKQTIFPLF